VVHCVQLVLVSLRHLTARCCARHACGRFDFRPFLKRVGCCLRCRYFLFNDILVWTERNFKFKDVLKLAPAHVNDKTKGPLWTQSWPCFGLSLLILMTTSCSGAVWLTNGAPLCCVQTTTRKRVRVGTS
jgi:hypothetical protein